MAASTAGHIVLRSRANGNSRVQSFTFSGAAKVTWDATGLTALDILAGGEEIVDIVFNNDGVTTVTQFALKINGIEVSRLKMVIFASDTAMPTRLVTPIMIQGGRSLQIETLA